MQTTLNAARLYGGVMIRGFRRYSSYRAATYAGVFTNTVFGFIIAYTYLALWSVKPHLGGYDAAQALTFVWLGQSLLAPMALFGGGFADDLSERIRKGDIAIDLYRPIDMQIWWLAADAGRAGFHLLGRGIAPTVAGALVFQLSLPVDPSIWPAFVGTLVLGFVVSYALRYIVALGTFWLLDDRGLRTLANTIAMFMSGMLIPLTVFPKAIGEIAQALPWSAVLQIPVDTLLGKHRGVDLLWTYAFQAVWALVLLIAGRALTAVATRKVVVQGG